MVSIENVSLQFGGRKIFDNITAMIRPGERVGLVGRNGAGKTTLLRLITGEYSASEGKVVVPNSQSLGYLPQHLSLKNTRNVFDEAFSAFDELRRMEKDIESLNRQLSERTDYETDAYMELVESLSNKTERLNLIQAGKAEAQVEQTLLGLGFKRSDFQRNTSEFSGGWRMRIELAKLLLQKPDIFLLDEPTNHLDIESIQWLEDFLKAYKGIIVLISHDRAFLDAVTNRTIEISLAKLFDFKSSYTRYVQLRAEQRELQMAAYRNQQKQIEETKAFIERFRYKATKAQQVQSRVKQLEKIDLIEIDEVDKSSMNIKFPPAPRSGQVVFKATGLTKAYDQNVVLNDIDISIERGEKVAFVGRNGEGKTTLSRIVINELDAGGEIKHGHQVSIGYFAQNQEALLDKNITVFDTIDRVAVGDVRTRIRDILGAFLFSGEEVDKKVSVLSGGEKSRLAMAKLLLEPYNLLVLDEPTNHLDMHSKDILKQALKDFDGTIIIVSHDREFLDGLVDVVYEFRDKKVKQHLGGIYDFLSKKKMESLNELNINQQKNAGPSKQKTLSNNEQFALRKEAEKKIRKVKVQVEEIESKIEKLESEIKNMDEQMANGSVNDQDLFDTYGQKQIKLETLLEEWDTMNNQLSLLQQERENI